MQHSEKDVAFVCNVCGAQNAYSLGLIDREIASCSCGSTVRMRSIVHLLSIALFQRSMPLPEFPEKPTVRGIGLSDWDGYAGQLEKIFNYTNTFFHTHPLLDICSPPASMNQSCDFLILTDVFEHVPPPRELAFHGAANLLKRGGHLIFSVPYTLRERTEEHFPNLHAFRIFRVGGYRFLVNRRRDGHFELHRKLKFHGGPGTTLEMRVFCRNDLTSQLDAAGFEILQIGEDAPEWGILHKHPWSLPMLVRKI